MKTIGQISAAVFRCFQSINGYKIRDLKIQSGQHDFLLTILIHEGTSQKEISERLCVGKSTTAKAIKELHRLGYVERRRDEHDRRVEHIFLTPAGRKAAAQVEAAYTETLKVAGAGLSPAEEKQLLSLMDRVLENLLAEKARIGDEV